MNTCDYFIQPLNEGETVPDYGYDRTVNAASMIEAMEEFMDEADFSEAEFRIENMDSGNIIYLEAMKTPDGYAFHHYPAAVEL